MVVVGDVCVHCGEPVIGYTGIGGTIWRDNEQDARCRSSRSGTHMPTAAN